MGLLFNMDSLGPGCYLVVTSEMHFPEVSKYDTLSAQDTPTEHGPWWKLGILLYSLGWQASLHQFVRVYHMILRNLKSLVQ